MTASNIDKFIKSARRWAGAVKSSGVSDAVTTTIELEQTTYLPTDTAVALVIDRVDSGGSLTPSKEEVIIGTVSGDNIVNCIRGVEGNAQSHAGGAIVELKLFSSVWNRLMSGILIAHNQDGTHDITKMITNGFVVDEDDMASNSATKVPTQQSVKAYIDTSVSSISITETSKSLTISNPTASDDISLFFTSEAITISKMACVLTGSSTPSVTWTVRHSTDRSLTGNEVVTSGTITTSTTIGSIVTTFNDATIPANSYVWFETTAKSGTVDSLNITIIYSKG